jgi:outer membrane protein
MIAKVPLILLLVVISRIFESIILSAAKNPESLVAALPENGRGKDYFLKITIFSLKESFMKLTIRIISSALILSLIIPALAWAEIKIAVVDMAEIIFNSAEGKKAQESVKRKGQELVKDLERRREEFGKQVEEYQKQAPVMKEDARKKKEEEFGKKQAELQQRVGSSQQELAKLEEKEFKPLYERFSKIVNVIAKENQYTVVLDKRVVIGFDPSIDISDKVRAAWGK